MRILIAEDERITRASLSRTLEGWGHHVTAAEDGELAWAAFRSGAYDIVITDWEMPNTSGLELIQRIRAGRPPLAPVPPAPAPVPAPESGPAEGYVYLIMLTSRSNKSDIVAGIEAGADDFLSKPFDKEELRVRLLAGERVVRLERTLSAQNEELRAAGERMRSDLMAAARVQRAMLPKGAVRSPRVNTAWTYVPTDELAGDAIGLHLFEDRYLVSYVIDVTGHGVPAALLSVTAMHALSPSGEGSPMSRLSGATGVAPGGTAPAAVLAELNRRFCAGDNDGRFLTMILGVLDTHTGRLCMARAGHPLPVVLRRGRPVAVSEEGGLPLALIDPTDYPGVDMPLEPGDRVCFFSDGLLEQFGPDGELFGEQRLTDLLASGTDDQPERLALRAVDGLAAWAGHRSFADDVSLVVIDWLGPG